MGVNELDQRHRAASSDARTPGRRVMSVGERLVRALLMTTHMNVVIAPDPSLAGCYPLGVVDDRRQGSVKRATITLLLFTFTMLLLVVVAFALDALWTSVLFGIVGGVVSIRLERKLTRLRGPAPGGFFRLASLIALCVGFQLFAPAVWCIDAFCQFIGAAAGHVH